MFNSMPNEAMTWVFAGDSITHGSFHNRESRNYVEHSAEVLRRQDGRGADVVVNVGVSGWRVPDLVADFHFRIARLEPSVVVLMLGTNDSTAGEEGVEIFASELEELALRILGLDADLVLQVPPPLRGGPSGRTAIPSYCDAIREVATRLMIPVVDHARDWGHHRPGDGIDEWLDDDIHPNAAGHLHMARTLLAALDVPGDPLDFA